MDNFQLLKSELEGLDCIDKVGDISLCTLSGRRHIEVDLYAADPQKARKIVELFLDSVYDSTNFRLIFFKV